MAMIEEGIADWPRASMAVIGSSLGGFYATHVAATTACRTVLLNPAVDPARELARHIGEQTAWHDPTQHFFFQPEFIGELRALEVGALPVPEQVLAIIAKGDEVLDWREMTVRYAGCRIELLEGSDHGLSDFEARHLDDVMRFIDPA